MVLRACASANTEPPFTLGGATLEMLPSLKRGLVGERRSHRRFAGPFRHAYRSVLPGRCRDGVGLSPVSVVSHCVQARPPVTLSVRSTEPSYGLRGEGGGPSSARLRQVRERGLPTRPKRDPSRTTLAWPLRQRLLPGAAGCVVSRRRFEQEFPYGDGPARVGLSGLGVARPPHRLRLSRPHLRLTPNPKRERGFCPALAHASG